MASLRDIHPIVLAQLKKSFTLNPVPLKYPFPERPGRTVGLVRIDGEVFSSEKLSRVVLLRIDLPFYFAVRSTFVRARVELDLPVFSCEVVITGKKITFMLDVHRPGKDGRHDDSALLDRLVKVRDKYPALLKERTSMVGDEIQSVLSKAACQAKITEDQSEDALAMCREYLGAFVDLLDKAAPLGGEQLERAKEDFEGYLKTVVDHDPGVKGYKMFFGEKGGVTRALDIFFDR
jgi:hypothetical protein